MLYEVITGEQCLYRMPAQCRSPRGKNHHRGAGKRNHGRISSSIGDLKMPQYYSADFLRHLRNDIPINEVIVDLLNLEVRKDCKILRFRCPICHNFHTATNHKTNLARCFDCKKNFNRITSYNVCYTKLLRIFQKAYSTPRNHKMIN